MVLVLHINLRLEENQTVCQLLKLKVLTILDLVEEVTNQARIVLMADRMVVVAMV